MKILIAPNAFKECLSAIEAARAIEEGVKAFDTSIECALCPIADGGDGTLEVLQAQSGARVVETDTCDPLGRPIRAPFVLLPGGETAMVESAKTAGLNLLKPQERNPLVATTRGTGEQIRAALEAGVDSILIGIGGTATVDGGTGLARALGYRFLDEAGEELPDGGGCLRDLAKIDTGGRDPRLDKLQVRIASDVTNPLLGESGAAKIFGPQKGATPEMVEQLEAGLAQFARVIESDLGIDVRGLPGAGAAGGMGAGLVAFLGGTFHSGVDLVLEETGFHEQLEGAALVITGEGSVDRQTAFGKGPAGVAKAAKAAGIPVYCLAGIVEESAAEALQEIGITRVLNINPPGSSLEESLCLAAERLNETTQKVLRQ